ncbi:hypothetical protein MHYP_G00126730 [Metynnis hypsauchen]
MEQDYLQIYRKQSYAANFVHPSTHSFSQEDRQGYPQHSPLLPSKSSPRAARLPLLTPLLPNRCSIGVRWDNVRARGPSS